MNPKLRFGKRHITLPRSRIARIFIGLLFIVGGLLGFLPVLGFWMLPVGIIILSADFALARRWRRRSEVALGNWRMPERKRKRKID